MDGLIWEISFSESFFLRGTIMGIYERRGYESRWGTSIWIKEWVERHCLGICAGIWPWKGKHLLQKEGGA